MKYLNNSLISYSEKILLFLLVTIPIQLLSGSAVINLSIVLSNFFILTILLINKQIFNNYYKIIYAFLLLSASLIINSFFSTSFDSSISRALSFLRFPLYVIAILYIFSYENYRRKIYFYWTIFFFIVFFDLIFEYYSGHNILGFRSYMPGRLVSFLNKELIIGNYYLGFSLLALSFVFNYVRQKKRLFIFFLSIVIILIGFLIGERSNFIKLFIIFFAFYIFFIEKKNIFYFLLIILTLLISLTMFIKTKSINSPIIHRWISITNQIENKENIFSFINSTQYGQHYKTAKKIFIKYPVFGSGLKTFRIESFKTEYEDLTDPMTNWRGATHPHQVHYEILSETGLIGYIIFFSFFSYFVIISINSFIRTKNIYQLSTILFVISAFIPLLPGGSFFSSYGATIFWVNFSVMIFYNRIK